jgi:hypothetical protein
MDKHLITDSFDFSTIVQVSDNRYIDENGYLVCKNAILGRTGTQRYNANEISHALKKFNLKGYTVVDVERRPEDVFNEASLRTLENKPFTFNHPNEWVNTKNHSSLSKGFVRDVYRDGDFIKGTIVVLDEGVKDQILNGERTELSLGYTCDYEYDAESEILYQKDIVYNHISLVQRGRAGVAKIVDEDTIVNGKENEQKMEKQTWLQKLLRVKQVGVIDGKDVYTLDEETIEEVVTEVKVETPVVEETVEVKPEETTIVEDTTTVAQEDDLEKVYASATETITNDEVVVEEPITDVKPEPDKVIVKDNKYFKEQRLIIDALPDGEDKTKLNATWKKEFFKFMGYDEVGDTALTTIKNKDEKGDFKVAEKTMAQKELELKNYYRQFNPHKNKNYDEFVRGEKDATVKDEVEAYIAENSK